MENGIILFADVGNMSLNKATKYTEQLLANSGPSMSFLSTWASIWAPISAAMFGRLF